MSPITHFLAGWAVANAARLERRERWLVTIAGVIPDADGLGIVAELVTRHSARPLLWWSDYHHILGHNLIFALLVTLGFTALARERRWLVAGLVLVSFHLHLLCDLIGAKGPDGYQWPIPYLWPFSNHWTWTWSGQWALNAWPNLAITAVLLGLALRWAWRRGYSPVECFSRRGDAVMVGALRARFGEPS
jgi:inner membrane protein